MTDETLETDGTTPGSETGTPEASEELLDGTLSVPSNPAEAVPVLVEALDAERETSAARLDDLQRIAAEFENYRKRSEREREETRQRASQRLVEALLPVLDSFDGAFAHEPQSPGEELLRKGLTSTYQQLMEILEREGLEPIEAAGASFDPELHEAVAGGIGENLVVAAELRRGYRLRGRVIRPAMVAVAPADGGEADEA